MMHFEELWEICEKFYQDNDKNNSPQEIINEISMKMDLYRRLDQKGIDQEELKKIKSRLFGEILLTLTNLSLIDNVNVFEALSIAHQIRSIEVYTKKYQD